MGQRRVASPVTATTDFLAAAILNKYGRAFPASFFFVHRTGMPTTAGPTRRCVTVDRSLSRRLRPPYSQTANVWHALTSSPERPRAILVT